MPQVHPFYRSLTGLLGASFALEEKNDLGPSTKAERKEAQMNKRTMERLVDVEVTRYGTIIQELEVICTMTGFRRRCSSSTPSRG